MDSNKTTISLFNTLLIIIIISVSSLPSSNSFSSDPKVSVELYYETLCPDSFDFILNHLVKLFRTGLVSIVDLKLSPYGNAKLRPNQTIVCQHGPNECLLNTIEACAIDTWPELNKHFPFIYCVEELVHERKYQQWESCFEKLSLDSKPVLDCYNSGHGKELELKYAAETDALQPPHNFVPWVVVNGHPLYEDYESFLSYICEAYKSTSIQMACIELSRDTIETQWAKHGRVVSFKDEVKVLTLWERVTSAVGAWMSQPDIVALE